MGGDLFAPVLIVSRAIVSRAIVGGAIVKPCRVLMYRADVLL